METKHIMATKLTKNLTRETEVISDGKELLLTITAEQTIELKPKGVRNGNGTLTIPISDLWEYLGGGGINPDGPIQTQRIKKTKTNEQMISLFDLRSMNAISNLSYGDMVKFDEIILDVINQNK